MAGRVEEIRLDQGNISHELNHHTILLISLVSYQSILILIQYTQNINPHQLSILYIFYLRKERSLLRLKNIHKKAQTFKKVIVEWA